MMKTVYRSIVGKGENTGDKHFLLFPTMLSSLSKLLSVFDSNLVTVCKYF